MGVLPVCVSVHPVCSGCRGQKRVLDPPGLELQKVVHPHVVLEIEPWFSVRASSALRLSCFSSP